MLSWTTRDMAKSLRISAVAAKQIIPVLRLEGYVKPGDAGDEWITTEAGEAVSGSKPPRYKREAIEQALSSLRDRIA